MATKLPLAPSALLEPSETLEPSSSTIYTDAPVGQIGGGTIVLGGGGIVKVGGTNVNQQPTRRQPRVYPQQAPPKLIHISYQVGHDAPTGRITLGGTLSEAFTPGASRVSLRDVRELERHFRLIYEQPTPEKPAAPFAVLTRDVLEPFTGGSTDDR